MELKTEYHRKFSWSDVEITISSFETDFKFLFSAKVIYREEIFVETFETLDAAKTWANKLVHEKAQFDCVVYDHIEKCTRSKEDYATDPEMLAIALISVESGVFSSGKACEVFRIERNTLMNPGMTVEKAFEILQKCYFKWNDTENF